MSYAKVINFQKILYPEEYKSDYVFMYMTLNDELKDLIGKSGYEKKFKIKIIISLASAAIGILMMVVGSMAGSASGDPNSGFYMLSLVGMFPLLGAAYIWLHSKKDEEDDDYGEKVKVPSGIMDYEKKSYHAIEAVFKSAGFTNVQCVPLNDLSVGLLKRPEMVESITIHGEKVTSGGDKYMPNASVVISYHSYPGRK